MELAIILVILAIGFRSAAKELDGSGGRKGKGKGPW